MKIVVKKVRLAFPQVWQAKAFQDGGDPRFSATGIVEKGSDNLKAIVAAVKQTAEGKWKDKADIILKELEKKGRLCYSTDPKCNGNGEPYDGFAGNAWITASSKERPQVRDRDKTALVEADGRPYGGCYINLILDVWAQDNQYGKRINAKLLAVQFVADGDAFSGGAVATDDDFEEIKVDDSVADLI